MKNKILNITSILAALLLVTNCFAQSGQNPQLAKAVGEAMVNVLANK